MAEKTEKIQIVPREPTDRKYMKCPCCDTILPIDAVTECSHCGAFLETHVHYSDGFEE